jgi:hypothetical protein
MLLIIHPAAILRSFELHLLLREPPPAPPSATFALPRETKTRKPFPASAFHGHRAGLYSQVV